MRVGRDGGMQFKKLIYFIILKLSTINLHKLYNKLLYVGRKYIYIYGQIYVWGLKKKDWKYNV